jgi:hypothetical protein
MKLILMAAGGALIAWLIGRYVFCDTLQIGFLSLALGGVFGAALDSIASEPPRIRV